MTIRELVERMHELNVKNVISTPIQPINDQNKGLNTFNTFITYDRKYPSWPCVLCGGSRFRLATSKSWICMDCVPREA